MWLIAILLGGCGVSPTSPTPTHPNEILITQHTQCYANYFKLGTITVSFFEDERLVDCSADWGYDEDGDPLMCQIAGAAYPGSRHAEYYGPWVRGETDTTREPDLEWAAAHEVCHMAGTWDEDQAKKCAELAWPRAQCHEGHPRAGRGRKYRCPTCKKVVKRKVAKSHCE
jgi:hypothetical protein